MRQIIGSFEDIGEKIVQETKKIPSDMVGKALESVGVPSGKSGQKNPVYTGTGKVQESRSDGPTDADRAVARAALAEFAKKPHQKEPGVYERQQKENDEKQKMMEDQQKAAAKSALPHTGAKQAPGGLFKKKKAPQNKAELKPKGAD